MSLDSERTQKEKGLKVEKEVISEENSLAKEYSYDSGGVCIMISGRIAERLQNVRNRVEF